MGGLDGQVALITGAAGAGIGQACARRLLADGAAVAITDVHERRTKEVSEALAVEFGERVRGYVLDVADRQRCDDVIAALESDLGAIDILVNNAAINVLGPISEYDPADWDRVLDVDLTACFYLARRVLPGMKERGRGSIVNISSVAGYLHGSGREGPYAAAKAGLHALTRGIAYEAGPDGVRCNAVAPGIIWSKFVERYADSFKGALDETPLRRFGTPEDIAKAVAWLCSEESSFVTGETLNVSGGWYMRP